MTASADDVLGASVSRIYALADPPPAHLLRLASGILSWRDPDRSLATLLVDSAVQGEAAGVRAASAAPRMLSFESGDTVIDVELLVADGEVQLVGQVSQAGVAPLEIRHRDGTWSGSTDAVGRFTADGLPAGPLRICWGPAVAGGETVCTPTLLT